MLVDENFLYGLLQIAGLFLAIVAGVIGISLFKVFHKRRELWSWKVLILALVVYALHKFFGALDAFNVYQTSTGWMSQIFPIFIQGFVLWALILEIYIATK